MFDLEVTEIFTLALTSLNTLAKSRNSISARWELSRSVFTLIHGVKNKDVPLPPRQSSVEILVEL